MALSKSAVDRLGERLRLGSVSDADWLLLEELRAGRQVAVDRLTDRIRAELGFAVTSRVKTVKTLIEKLHRQSGMRLSQMDDLAGARIVVSGGRADQDACAEAVARLWPEVRIKDRREHPVHGYRALHVIPSIDGWPIEIQIRTIWQDAIASALESAADGWGRQIRYGGRPDDPEALAFPDGRAKVTRLGYIELLEGIADFVADIEATILKRDRLAALAVRTSHEEQALRVLEEELEAQRLQLIALGIVGLAAAINTVLQERNDRPDE